MLRVIVDFWGKYGNHITAISVLLFLCYVSYYIYDDMQMKKVISENCGWGEEDYHCYCEKSEAMRIKNIIDQKLQIGDGGFLNVTLV